MTVRSRWLALSLAPLVTVVLAIVAPSPAAHASPNGTGSGSSSHADEGDHELSDNATLNEVLESTNRKYTQAKAAVDKSTKQQVLLTAQLGAATARRDALVPEVNAIAAQQYRTGRLSGVTFLLSSAGSSDFLHKAVSLDEISTLHDRKLHELDQAIDEVNAKEAALAAEIKSKQANLVAMRQQKRAADKALALVGGEGLTQGFVLAKSPVAAPAPRNSQGGFSPEGCTVNDPTTGGCITPRMYHLYKETKKAGFNRFVGCHRNGGPYEHPKGRACDWSLQQRGFSVAHNADMKRYGNNLMAFLVRNADRLGIYYVIWYAQIWFPATGWHRYHGPSSHKDHVHVSVL